MSECVYYDVIREKGDEGYVCDACMCEIEMDASCINCGAQNAAGEDGTCPECMAEADDACPF